MPPFSVASLCRGKRTFSKFKDKLFKLGPCISKADVYLAKKMNCCFLTWECLRDNAILKSTPVAPGMSFNTSHCNSDEISLKKKTESNSNIFHHIHRLLS